MRPRPPQNFIFLIFFFFFFLFFFFLIYSECVVSRDLLFTYSNSKRQLHLLLPHKYIPSMPQNVIHIYPSKNVRLYCIARCNNSRTQQKRMRTRKNIVDVILPKIIRKILFPESFIKIQWRWGERVLTFGQVRTYGGRGVWKCQFSPDILYVCPLSYCCCYFIKSCVKLYL